MVRLQVAVLTQRAEIQRAEIVEQGPVVDCDYVILNALQCAAGGPECHVENIELYVHCIFTQLDLLQQWVTEQQEACEKAAERAQQAAAQQAAAAGEPPTYTLLMCGLMILVTLQMVRMFFMLRCCMLVMFAKSRPDLLRP